MSGEVESIIGAIKTVIVADGVVSGRVFKDRAPAGATAPYVVLTDISMASGLTGDGGRTMAWTHPVQASLWQTLRAESRTLLVDLIDALDGAALAVPGAKVYACAVSDTQRIVDPDGEVVQDAVTLQVRHDGATV